PGPGYGARSDVRWPHRRSDKYLEYPIYLAYVVATLEKAGIDVHFIDGVENDLSVQAFAEQAMKIKPDLIAMECSTPSITKDLHTAKTLKEKLEDTFIVLMGSHPTYFHKEILSENKFVDAIARGEFDLTIRDLSLALKNEKRQLDDVKGISYRAGDTIRVNEDRPPIQDLDSLPFPARHIVKSDSYREAVFTGRRCATIVSSRGCPYQCIFCLWPRTMYGRKFRKRSPGNVVDEVQHVVDEYGVDEIYFDDDCLTLNRNRLLEICKEIVRRDIKVKWMCQARVNNVDQEILEAMKKAGCHYIKYGVESGSQKMLDVMKKGITLESVRRAFKLTRKAGIKTQAFFLFGLPWETPETAKKTIEFAKEIKPDSAQFAVVVPHPGTELYDLCLEKGWLNYDSWDDFDCRRALIETENLSAEDVQRHRTQAYREFYLRPSYILRTTLKMWNPKEAKRIIRSARSIMERISYY
ncbi:MAG: radical SAM protein, partial [Candidatus Bathyarchaeota archaeon]|nr:radical SAM protein [Candidatus Bathyarchaeota archaeon]